MHIRTEYKWSYYEIRQINNPDFNNESSEIKYYHLAINKGNEYIINHDCEINPHVNILWNPNYATVIMIIQLYSQLFHANYSYIWLTKLGDIRLPIKWTS